MSDLEIPNTFKGKLNWLIRHITAPGGKPYTDKQIAQAAGVSVNYIWRLRNDPKVNNPSLEVAQAIANFFKVNLSFFQESSTQDELKDALGDVFMNQIAMRSEALDKLSDKNKEALLLLIDHVLNSEKSTHEMADE